MSGKENFVQALRELTGFNEEPGNSGNEGKIISYSREAAEDNNSQERNTHLVHSSAEYKTHITANMVVKGMVQSKSNILVEGSVQGDIQAEKIVVTAAEVKGNMFISSKAEVCGNSEITGNIFAENIVVSGNVKGDLQIGDTTVLKAGAYIEGNIKTGNIISDSGAGIRGTVVTGYHGAYDEEKSDLGGVINE